MAAIISAAPMGKDYGNIAEGSHVAVPFIVGDRQMMILDEKTGSLTHTRFIQGCPGSFSCTSIVQWIKPTSILSPMGSDQVMFWVGFEPTFSEPVVGQNKHS